MAGSQSGGGFGGSAGGQPQQISPFVGQTAQTQQFMMPQMGGPQNGAQSKGGGSSATPQPPAAPAYNSAPAQLAPTPPANGIAPPRRHIGL